MGNKRRKYTKEFKKEYVEYLIRTGKPASKVSAELGIRQELLSRWRREYEQVTNLRLLLEYATIGGEGC